MALSSTNNKIVSPKLTPPMRPAWNFNLFRSTCIVVLLLTNLCLTDARSCLAQGGSKPLTTSSNAAPTTKTFSLDPEIVIVIPEGPVSADSKALSGETRISLKGMKESDDASFYWEIEDPIKRLELRLEDPSPLAGAVIRTKPETTGKAYLDVTASSTEISKDRDAWVRVKLVNANSAPPGIYRGSLEFPILYQKPKSRSEDSGEKIETSNLPEGAELDPAEGVPPLSGRVRITLIRGGRFISSIRLVDGQSPVNKPPTPLSFGKPIRIEIDVDTFGTLSLVDDPGTVRFQLQGAFNDKPGFELAQLTLPLKQPMWHVNRTLFKRAIAKAKIPSDEAIQATPNTRMSPPVFEGAAVDTATDSSRLFNWRTSSEGGPPSWRDPVVWGEKGANSIAGSPDGYRPTSFDSNASRAASDLARGFWKRHTHRVRVPAIDVPRATLTITAKSISPKPIGTDFEQQPKTTNFELRSEGLAVFPALAYEGQEVTVVLATAEDLGPTIKVQMAHADAGSKAGVIAPFEVVLHRHSDHRSYRCKAGGGRLELARIKAKPRAPAAPREHAIVEKSGTWNVRLDPNQTELKRLPEVCQSAQVKVPLASQPSGARSKSFFVFLKSTPLAWGVKHFSWHLTNRSRHYYLPEDPWETKTDDAYALTQVPGYFNDGRLLLGESYPVGETFAQSQLRLFSVQAGSFSPGSTIFANEMDLPTDQKTVIAMRATFNSERNETIRNSVPVWKKVQEEMKPEDLKPRTVHFEIPHLVVLSNGSENQEVMLFTVPVDVRLETPDLDNRFLIIGCCLFFLFVLTVAVIVWKVRASTIAKRPKIASAAAPPPRSTHPAPRTESSPEARTPGPLDD